jgi:tetratricopeptide (TPR) repeat protein
MIFPTNQMIDYVYPISKDFFDPAVLLSFILLSALFLSSMLLLFQWGRWNVSQELRIAGFGGLWFFITISVESSIIPITDIIFEHRLYLPTVGAFIAFAVAGSAFLNCLRARYPVSAGIVYTVIVCILMALPVATHVRNRVWRSEIALWEDVASKAPENARAQAIIGIGQISKGNIDQAIERFQKAISIKPDYSDAVICLGNAYLEKGMLEEGYQQFLKALTIGNMDFESRAQLMMNIGNYNIKKGQLDMAIYYYNNALSITPNVASIHYNLGQAFKVKGMADKATEEFNRARQLNPDRY